jgi:hypothetical protein
VTRVDIGGGGRGGGDTGCEGPGAGLLLRGVDCRPADDVGREMLGCPLVGRAAPGLMGVDVVLDRCVFGAARGV